MKAKELECINKLVYEDMFYELKEFLIDNKLAKEDDFKALTRNTERAKFICRTLDEAAKEEKLQLLDYEWVFLPKEFIKVTCVTETEKKEFIYGL